ncbi:MAG TPA: pilus assembly protein PilM [Methylophilaceae bacterium]|nr:pilus assembly protein PilM [Methylophilaceae bacterium]
MEFDFFKKKELPLIGVDISSAAIKMVELSEGSKGGYRVEGYAIAPLPKDAVTDGNITNLEQTGEAVKRAWKLLGSRERRVALALPVAAVISKKVIMQADLREEDMELRVEAEANQYIPFSLDEVNIDFQVVGPASSSEDEVEVLIAASRKEKIEDRVASVEAAGLKAVVMDVETYATEAAYQLAAKQLPQGGREQTVMVVDIGAFMMHVNVLHNNESVYIREQNFGGNQLTLEIQRRFGLSAEEAEIAKRKGGLPESYEPELLQPFVQSLAMEVARAVHFFTSSTQFNQIDHVMLAGGCAAIPGVDQAVADRVRVNTIIANPFINMSFSNRVNQQSLLAEAPSLMIACGLALRRFD